MPDKEEPKQAEVIVKKDEVVIQNPPIQKPIISGVDQHVVLSQEDIDARQ